LHIHFPDTNVRDWVLLQVKQITLPKTFAVEMQPTIFVQRRVIIHYPFGQKHMFRKRNIGESHNLQTPVCRIGSWITYTQPATLEHPPLTTRPT